MKQVSRLLPQKKKVPTLIKYLVFLQTVQTKAREATVPRTRWLEENVTTNIDVQPLTKHYMYDLLREEKVESITQVGSVAVIRDVTSASVFLEENETPPPSGEVALCHLTALWRYSTLEKNEDDGPLIPKSLGPGFYGDSAGVLLAAHHFNHGIGDVVDELHDIHKRCNVRFTVEFFDSFSSTVRAVEQISDACRREDPVLEGPKPCAVLGAFRSAVSAAAAVVTGIHGLPQISPVSSSPDLDNQFRYPLFSRLVPSDAGTSLLTVKRLKGLGVNHVGVINVNDAYGNAYQRAFKSVAESFGIKVSVHSFNFNSDPSEIREAVKGLQETGYNYFFGIVFGPEHYDIVMTEAYKRGIAGNPNRVTSWIFAGGVQRYVQNVKYPQGSPLALATHGSGMIQADGGIEGMPGFDRFMRVWKSLDEDDVDFFNSKQPKDGDYYYKADSEYFQRNEPERETLFAYDMVTALGLAACEASTENNSSYFDGQEHFDRVVQTTFVGASGQVRIDPDTTSRDPTSALYVIFNAVPREPDEDGMVSFRVEPAVVFLPKINPDDAGWESIPGKEFVFSDGTKTPPPPLPPVEMNMNYIGTSLRALGLFLAGTVAALSITFATWTYTSRRKRIIRASQPIFLVLICAGTMIMGSAIVPLSFDDEIASQRGSDIACMAVPWLYSIGFVLAFSALFSKTWRINQIFHNHKMKRIRVTAKDVMFPLFLLLLSNVVVLTAWTVVDPLRWVRSFGIAMDEYGREKESFGLCRSSGKGSLPFGLVLLCIDFLAVFVANLQLYRARDINTEFSESRSIGIAMGSIMQAWFFGIPLTVIVYKDPRALFFVLTGLIFVTSMAILLLIFVPKVRYLRKIGSSSRDDTPQIPKRFSARHLTRSAYHGRNHDYNGPQTSEHSSKVSGARSGVHCEAVNNSNSNESNENDSSSKAVQGTEERAKKKCDVGRNCEREMDYETGCRPTVTLENLHHEEPCSDQERRLSGSTWDDDGAGVRVLDNPLVAENLDLVERLRSRDAELDRRDRKMDALAKKISRILGKTGAHAESEVSTLDAIRAATFEIQQEESSSFAEQDASERLKGQSSESPRQATVTVTVVAMQELLDLANVNGHGAGRLARLPDTIRRKSSSPLKRASLFGVSKK